MISRVSPVDFENLRVLIVDDNAFVRKLIRSMLRQLGVTSILEAGNGLEAIERLNAQDCDLVLLDWKMPEMNGDQVLITLRQHNKAYFRNLPVILITGYANQSLVLKAVHQGADAIVVKPFSISLLKHRIESATLKRRQETMAFERIVEQPRENPVDPEFVFDIDAVM